MKSVIFCDFWGVPKEILGSGSVENVLIPPFLERVDLVPVDEGEKIVVATISNKGLNPDFYNLLLKKEKILVDKGIKLQASAQNQFAINYDTATAPYAIAQGKEREFVYNIYNNIYSNIQYNISGEKIRTISTKKLSLSDLANFVTKSRYLVKRYGEELSTFFIPKPFSKSQGVGFELSFFVEGDDKTVDCFLAGLLIHAPEYAVFTNSCENSYARLGGKDCAHYVCWGDNEDCLIKVWKKKDCREIVLSFPDASGNPYLLLSALLEAGTMGVENQNKLPDKVECVTPAVQKELVRMPFSLKEGLSLSQESGFMQRVMGEGLSHVFYKYKEKEIEDFKGITTEDEYFKKYSEIL